MHLIVFVILITNTRFQYFQSLTKTSRTAPGSRLGFRRYLLRYMLRYHSSVLSVRLTCLDWSLDSARATWWRHGGKLSHSDSLACPGRPPESASFFCIASSRPLLRIRSFLRSHSIHRPQSLLPRCPPLASVLRSIDTRFDDTYKQTEGTIAYEIAHPTPCTVAAHRRNTRSSPASFPSLCASLSLSVSAPAARALQQEELARLPHDSVTVQHIGCRQSWVSWATRAASSCSLPLPTAPPRVPSQSRLYCSFAVALSPSTHLGTCICAAHIST